MDKSDLIVAPTSTYIIESLNIPLKLHQGSDGGTFGLSRTGQVLWDGCFTLSRYIEHNTSAIRDKSILELGCGCCGLPGQVSAVLGASRIVFSDITEELECLQSTLHLNSEHHKASIAFAPLDWTVAFKDSKLYGQLQYDQFDVILCSDILYEHTYITALYVLLLLAQKSPHASIIMANTNRKHVQLFRRKAIAYFDFTAIDTQQKPFADYVNQVLWKMRLKSDIDVHAILHDFCS